MIWLLLLIILIFIVLFFPTYIYIKYDNKREKKIESKIILFKDLIHIPLNFKNIQSATKKKNKKYQKFKESIEKYKKPIQYFGSCINLKKFSWNTSIGFENAAWTGFLAGVLWSMKHNILSYILQYKTIEEFSINVEPCFNERKFQTQVNCIIGCKFVHIIIVSIWILILNKGGERFARTSYRRAYEGNDE